MQHVRHWALPPRPAEQWPGRIASYALLGTIGLIAFLVLLVGLSTLSARSTLVSALYASGAATAVLCAGLLEVQSAVLEDRRLRGPAVALLVMAVASAARCVHPAGAGLPVGAADRHLAAGAAVLWLLALPAGCVGALLPRRLLVVPVVVAVGAAVALGLTPLSDDSPVRMASAVAAGCCGAAVLAWQRELHRVVRAGEIVAVALLLVAVVALVRVVMTPSLLTYGGLEAAVTVTLVVALWQQHASGYGPQARRWRRLEQEIGGLRVSSALMPGLSITPEDDAGLPEPEVVAALLDEGRAAVAVQPVFELETMRVWGQEALARLGGRVPTDRWFRAAGMHGRGTDLERLTLSAALRTLDELPPEQLLAVNVSPASLRDDVVLGMLHASDLTRLVVEVTEHEAVSDYAFARRVLQRLRDGGARIAVDDVGSGFASLRHVLLLQPDVIKLDARLTRGVHQSERQLAIVRALVSFADQVGTVVLAEGIEYAEQVEPLASVGVTLGQGWHLGVPVLVPSSVPENWL